MVKNRTVSVLLTSFAFVLLTAFGAWATPVYLVDSKFQAFCKEMATRVHENTFSTRVGTQSISENFNMPLQRNSGSMAAEFSPRKIKDTSAFSSLPSAANNDLISMVVDYDDMMYKRKQYFVTYHNAYGSEATAKISEAAIEAVRTYDDSLQDDVAMLLKQETAVHKGLMALYNDLQDVVSHKSEPDWAKLRSDNRFRHLVESGKVSWPPRDSEMEKANLPAEYGLTDLVMANGRTKSDIYGFLSDVDKDTQNLQNCYRFIKKVNDTLGDLKNRNGDVRSATDKLKNDLGSSRVSDALKASAAYDLKKELENAISEESRNYEDAARLHEKIYKAGKEIADFFNSDGGAPYQLYQGKHKVFQDVDGNYCATVTKAAESYAKKMTDLYLAAAQ